MWKPQKDALRDLFRMIAPDLPGFGDSPLPTGTPTVEGYADAVAGLLDDKDIHDPVVLAGVSMGGYIALAFARKYSHRLAGLVLSDTKAGPDDATGKANRDRMIAEVKAGLSEAVVEGLVPKLLGPATKEESPEIEDAVRDLGLAQKPEALVAALAAMRDRPDSTPGLAGIRVPTLVIVGQDDMLTPPDEARKLVAGIKGARLAIIEKAGHLPNVEQPRDFNDVLMAFLVMAAQG
jgi:pimeloyl-ACP methyl ester carboxylesterase